MCNRSTERFGLDVVREPAPAVDLDDRKPFPIFGLEGRVAPDVDLAQVEAELGMQRAHLFERALAQVAVLGVVNDDSNYG